MGKNLFGRLKAKKKYKELLTKAKENVVVSLGSYSPAKLHLRNHWIVNHSDQLLAIWNGKQSGGTFECVNFAKTKENYPITIISPQG